LPNEAYDASRPRAQATSDFRSLAGTDGWTISRCGFEASRLTGTKSRSGSKGSLAIRCWLITKLAATISSCWPSAGAACTAWAPITVPPPGLLSTRMVWPPNGDMRSASARLIMSPTPPGA